MANLPSVAGYDILGVLGRGGMGVVYQARQDSLRRLVALKMILTGGHAGEQERARFRAEAEAAARLQHPNIVQIHQIGEQDGQPFFSLEYVDGGSLAGKLNGTPEPPAEAARLVEVLARAVQAAHERGVVHRDLKPANILLASDGTPKITDFGLAKQLDEGDDQTRTGAILGTPSYMAPEQAAGQSKNVGPACDVYALGAILYECVTGRPPFRAATALETLEQVRSQEPVPPARLQPKVPRDLDTICLKCLEKEPAKRYPSAWALAEDLRRFLGGEPILARPVGAAGRLLKWAKRRPAVAALLTVVVLATLSLLIVGGLWYQARLDASDSRAELAAREVELLQEQTEQERRQTQKANKLRERAEKGEKEARDNETEALRQRDSARRNEYGLQLALVATLWERQPARGLELLEDTERCPESLRDFAWGYAYRVCKRDWLTLRGHQAPIQLVQYSRDGNSLVSHSIDGVVNVWDVATGKLRSTFKVQGPVAVLPGARFMVNQGIGFVLEGDPRTAHLRQLVAVGNPSGTIQLWNLIRGQVQATLEGHKTPIISLLFTPDGKRLASLDKAGVVKVWDVEQAEEKASVPAGGLVPEFLAISPNGKWVATGTEARRDREKPSEVKVHDATTGKELAVLQTQGPVAFSLDGRLLATGWVTRGRFGTAEIVANPSGAKLWDTATWKEGRTLGLGTPATRLEFTPDGRSLLVSGVKAGSTLWNVNTMEMQGSGGNNQTFSLDGRLTASTEASIVGVSGASSGGGGTTLKGHRSAVTALAFAPNSAVLATGSRDGTIKCWNVTTDQGHFLKEASNDVSAVAFSPDGKVIAAANNIDSVTLCDTVAGTTRTTERSQAKALGVAISPDGRTLASVHLNGEVKLYDLGTGKVRSSVKGHQAWARCVIFSPDGKTLASSAYYEGVVCLWDTATGQQRGRLVGHGSNILSLAFCPDGKTLAVPGGKPVENRPYEVKLWDTATWKERAALRGHAGDVHAVAFAPDGKTLVSGSADTTARLWDSETGRELAVFRGHEKAVAFVTFSPDGKTLATGGSDGIKLRDPVTGQLRTTLTTFLDGAQPVFSPDSRTLVVPGSGLARIFKVLTPPVQPVLRGHSGEIRYLAFTPDGKTLLSGGPEASVQRWDVATRQKQKTAFGPGGLLSALSPDGRLVATAASRFQFRTVDDKPIFEYVPEVKISDALTGQEQATLQAPPVPAASTNGEYVFRSLAFSGDGQLLAVGMGGGPARVWDVAGRKVHTSLKDAGFVSCLAFTPDGKTLATARVLVQFWDTANGQERARLPAHKYPVTVLTVAPDGKTLASASDDGIVKVCDVAAGKERTEFKGHEGPISSLAFARGGRLLAVGATNGIVKLWDTVAVKELAALEGHTVKVAVMTWTPDGKTLASGDGEGLIRLWEMRDVLNQPAPR